MNKLVRNIDVSEVHVLCLLMTDRETFVEY